MVIFVRCIVVNLVLWIEGSGFVFVRLRDVDLVDRVIVKYVFMCSFLDENRFVCSLSIVDSGIFCFFIFD